MVCSIRETMCGAAHKVLTSLHGCDLPFKLPRTLVSRCIQDTTNMLEPTGKSACLLGSPDETRIPVGDESQRSSASPEHLLLLRGMGLNGLP